MRAEIDVEGPEVDEDAEAAEDCDKLRRGFLFAGANISMRFSCRFAEGAGAAALEDETEMVGFLVVDSTAGLVLDILKSSM